MMLQLLMLMKSPIVPLFDCSRFIDFYFVVVVVEIILATRSYYLVAPIYIK